MPIYAYKCESCGHQQDVLQKLSDPVLSTCPSCGKETFAKQITAAGFQLKGSGWYQTDFRNNGNGGAKPAAAPGEAKTAETPAAAAACPACPGPAGGCATAPAPAPSQAS